MARCCSGVRGDISPGASLIMMGMLSNHRAGPHSVFPSLLFQNDQKPLAIKGETLNKKKVFGD